MNIIDLNSEQFQELITETIKGKLQEYEIATGNDYHNTHFIDDDIIDFVNNDGKPEVVKWYMFNKIRSYLGGEQKTHGFPSRIGRSVGFYGLLMFSIPDYYTVHKVDTTSLWLKDPSKAWREVIIYQIPNEYIMDIMSIISSVPLGILNGVRTVIDITVKQITKKSYPIFENLIQTGGVSDLVIEANWDKIKAFLRRKYHSSYRDY